MDNIVLQADPGCISAIFNGWIINATKIEEGPNKGYPKIITINLPNPRDSCHNSTGIIFNFFLPIKSSSKAIVPIAATI